jgi:hypothetical protein
MVVDNLNIKSFREAIDACDRYLFRKVALRGYILRRDLVPTEDYDMSWIVTPFDSQGEPCGKSLILLDWNLRDDDIDRWIARTPIIFTEAELPERIKHLDVYGLNEDERAAHEAQWEKEMLEFERELLLCGAPEDVMH